MVFTAAIYPQPLAAATTTADFLKWERKAQDSFFQISISMAGVIASQVRPEMAKCIDDWYYGDQSLESQHHTEILEIMSDYLEFKPHAVLLGYLEAICGKINAKKP